MKESILEMQDVSYSYENKRKILEKANYKFETGKMYAIVGPSGSGKTTTLSLAGALDNPNSGKILYKGKDIKKIGYTKYRSKYISFIFQSYNLLNYMTALENVILGMDISKSCKKNKKEIASNLLKDVGLNESEIKRNVKKLSGGQQQRVAIARALASDTEIILADEPTGNLDKQTTLEIMNIFKKLASDKNKCVIIVTHSNIVSDLAGEIVEINDNKLEKVK